MFGRRVTKAIRPGVVSLERNSVRNDEKRMEDGYGHAREAFGHASHHEDALVAINRHWCLRRTARHIVCHLVHHGRCRHFIRHRRYGSLRWCTRHDRPGNRRHYKTRDHQDREQPTDGEIAVHGIKLSQTSGDKKATSLKVMELYLSCIDRYQVANKFDVRKGSKRGDSTMFELLPLLWDSYGQAPDLDGVGDVPRAIAGSKRGAH